ncbi:nuclear pore complex protein Nup155-like [Clytia hemisphaerica]|uniref:Nuclear pore complex protein Nup155 n=1 Tax=Clytia hemisphaerica TaxID=252671 RepID=A0A7M5WQ88_9CNID
MILLKDKRSLNSAASVAESLDSAIKELEKHFISDTKFPTLEEQLKIGSYPNFSGVNDFDYQPLASADGISGGDKQVTSTKRVPLPDELLEQFAHMQCNCVMGLFPEISRAWLAIDSDIYFWVYEDGSDIAYYDGIKEVILAAGLVTPKPGIFQEHIKHILCVTTPVNIYLLGLNLSERQQSLSGDMFGTLQLHPEPLFVIPTDNVYLTSICGTANGRIFLGGKDGCLYEVVYQVQKVWFGKQCYKINHSSSKMSFLVPNFVTNAIYKEDAISQLAVDNSRGILYYRTEEGNIKVCYLGEQMDTFRFVASANSSSLAAESAYVTRTVDKKNFEKIVHIAPVSKNDASYTHLVGITQTGVRLYFTTTSFNNPYGEPYLIKLIHIRMPPGYAPSLSSQKPGNIHAAFYRKGLCLAIGSLSTDMDKFWCFSPDAFPFKMNLKESQSTFNIDGHTWSLGEIPDFGEYTNTPGHLFKETFQDPPAIVTEHVHPPRRFILLSAQGSHIITTLRPVEQLQSALSSGYGADSDLIAAYFQQYGTTQACATCLVLICQSRESEKELADLATEAFFRFGDEQAVQEMQSMSTTHYPMQQPTMQNNSYIVRSPTQGGSSQGSFLGTPIAQGLHQTIQTPQPPNMNSTLVNQTTTQHKLNDGQSTFSGKHNGIYLYFTRIMRPIWNYPLVFETIDCNGKHQLMSRISATDLSWFIVRLQSLKNFLTRYSDTTLSQSPVHRTYHTLTPKHGSNNSHLTEKSSLMAFLHLVSMSIEGLELWRLICEHQFHVVIHNANQEIQEQIRQIAFKDLFSPNGQQLSTQLVNCVMATCMSDNTAVETTSDYLRNACPSLFSADDAICAKANKIVQNSSSIQSTVERNRNFFEAIKLYSEVPHLIDLQWTCDQFASYYFYEGIVEVCLNIAVKRDPTGVALHYFKNGEPRDDVEGMEMFNYRNEAYSCITQTLENLLNQITNPATLSIPSRPGPPVNSEISTLTAESAQNHYDNIITRSLTSRDELFHVALFDWLIKKDQTNTLLQIKSPFLEHYLITLAAQQHPGNKKTLDLVWMYYEKNNNFIAAAKILLKLAEMQGPSLTIHNRMEYLSRAVVTTKSSSATANSNEGEFLQEIEEKLDVARVQLKIFEELSKKKSNSPEMNDAMVKLNSKLFDISTLYGEFAEEFSLPECKLDIIACANHNNETLVKQIWKEIQDKLFTEVRHLPMEERGKVVAMEMIKHGKEYAQNEQFFPINFLVNQMEIRACELNLDQTWVFSMFLEMEVPISSLLMTYATLIGLKEITWKTLGKPLHLWGSFALLTSYLLDNNKFESTRLSMCRSLFETTTSYLVDLDSMDASEPEVRVLLQRFKNNQMRLKRML